MKDAGNILNIESVRLKIILYLPLKTDLFPAMRSVTKKYSNGEVTIVWKSGLCKHATYCYRALPKVFDPGQRPWVDPNGAPTQRIIDQVKRCPSGALSYFMDAGGDPDLKPEPEPETETTGNP
jgi:uncharacterized Fe-S cluster protein YjdI